MNIERIKDPRDALRAHLLELKPNIAMVFVFNIHRRKQAKTMNEILSQRELSVENAKKKMARFFNYLQDDTFGPRWNEHTRRAWPAAWGFCENPTTNLHYHVFVDACPRFTRAIYDRGEKTWRSIIPAAGLYFELPEELGRAVRYWTKQVQRSGRIDAIFEYGPPIRKRER